MSEPGDAPVTGLFFSDGAMKTVAIIPAGGTGRRMGGEIPKQYLSARRNRPSWSIPFVHFNPLRWSMKCSWWFRRAISRRFAGSGRTVRLAKVGVVLAGGRERQDSVRNALAHVDDGYGMIVVHDGVRPFVTGDLIERVIVAAGRVRRGESAGLPVRDTVKEADPRREGC